MGKWEIVNDEWDLEDSGWAHRCSTLNVNESILKTNSVFSGRIKYTHRPLTVAFQCLLILVFKTSPINTWKLFFFSSSIILDQLILLTPLSSKSHSAFTISHFPFLIPHSQFSVLVTSITALHSAFTSWDINRVRNITERLFVVSVIPLGTHTFSF